MVNNDGPQVSIRPATAEDIDGLVASNAALFAEDATTRDTLRNPAWPREYGPRRLTENLANPDILMLAADSAGQVVGHLTGVYYPVSEMWVQPRAYLMSMNVMPGWRAQGIGSRLVEGFAAWARDRGVGQLRVTAYYSNDAAIRFYRRHGFAPLETTLVADF